MGKLDLEEGIGLNDTFRFYRNNRRERKEKGLQLAMYRKVLQSYHHKIAEMALTGIPVQLPHEMGYLRVIGRKPSYGKMGIDFQATKEHGQTIYHDNRETAGLYFQWHWVSPNHKLRNMGHYRFWPTRGNNGKSLKERLGQKLKIPNYYKRFNKYAT